MNDEKISYRILGHIYNCGVCNEQRGIINEVDYNIEKYKDLADFYEKEWKIAENGHKLLTMCIDEKMTCPSCLGS